MLNKGYFGYIGAVAFNKEANSIEVILNTPTQSRLMRHKVGAMQGISKSASRDLWHQLHKAMDEKSCVQFFYRGNWKAWFDVIEIMEEQTNEDDLEFAAMIGVE